MPTVYQCRDCGHPYGSTPPSAPVIALHRAVSHSGATPILETAPRTPRRVRSDMVPRGAQAAYPRPVLYVVVERPRVVSTCGNRPPLWEWRTAGAVEIGTAR